MSSAIVFPANTSPKRPEAILLIGGEWAGSDEVARVYLTLGCDMECSIYAHGHLNLTRGRRHRHLGLRPVLGTLQAGHAQRIALSLSIRPGLRDSRFAARDGVDSVDRAVE